MKEELITSVANILNKWNPLGDKAANVEGLDGYRWEAIDILSTMDIDNSPVKKIVEQVLTEAFRIYFIELNDSELHQYSIEIKQVIKAQSRKAKR